MELQRQTAMATLAEAQPKTRHINAQAAELEVWQASAPRHPPATLRPIRLAGGRCRNP